MNRREVRMVALRAALVAVMLAAMVATFMALALLTRRSLEGTAHGSHAGAADAISIDTDGGGSSATAPAATADMAAVSPRVERDDSNIPQSNAIVRLPAQTHYR